MGVFAKIVSAVKEIDQIKTQVENNQKNIVSVWTFVDGVRKYLWGDKSNLIFSSTKPGAYSWTVPSEYDGAKVIIKYSGGGGGIFNGLALSAYTYGRAGNAELKEYTVVVHTGDVISGTVGSAGLDKEEPNVSNGGTGYNNGASGTLITGMGGLWARGGGGGGSTSLLVNDDLIGEASAGGGMYGGRSDVTGGKGAGPNGGTQGMSAGNGLGATGAIYDRSAGNTEAEDGFVEIYFA